MAGPNYFWKTVWWLTHVGLTPVQAWVTVADAVLSSVRTVLDTWRNLLKTLAYPFTTKTWKPKWKEDYKKTWWKEWFSARQKDHWNKYIAPFKWDANQAPLLAKATGWIAHFATAIPANAIMTTLDGTYSAVKTPFSILKNIWKTVIYPFTTKTWKPTFGKDLKEIWWKENWFTARTRNSWKETFDVIPKKWTIWSDKMEDKWWKDEDDIEIINTQVQSKPEAKPVEKKSPESLKTENKSDWKTNNWDKISKDSNDKEQTKNGSEDSKTEKEEKTESNLFETLDTKEISNLEDLVLKMWFEETKEMKKLRTEIIELLKNDWDYKTKYIEYEDLAKKHIEWTKEWKKIPHICLDLIQAHMIKLSWNKKFGKDYYEKIKDSRYYAEGMWYKKIVEAIDKITKNKKKNWK